MRLERFQKSARIPVRVRNGQIEFLYDTEFPPLEDGELGELVVDINTIKDPAWQKFLVAKEPVLTADAGDLVAFKVATNKGARDLEKHLISFRESLNLMGAKVSNPRDADGLAAFGDGFGVLGELTTPLTINLRGENLSKLSGGAVEIPALRELKRPHQAISLNQALVMVSRIFEPERESNVGDAFRDIYLLTENRWGLLDTIRSDFEAQHEVERWETIGLEPQKVRERIRNKGGLLPNESTRNDFRRPRSGIRCAAFGFRRAAFDSRRAGARIRRAIFDYAYHCWVTMLAIPVSHPKIPIRDQKIIYVRRRFVTVWAPQAHSGFRRR